MIAGATLVELIDIVVVEEEVAVGVEVAVAFVGWLDSWLRGWLRLVTTGGRQ